MMGVDAIMMAYDGDARRASSCWVLQRARLMRPFAVTRTTCIYIYVYIYVRQGDFDVRWLRGSASELIFSPWQRAIERDGGRVLGGKRVSSIRFPQTALTTTAQGDVAGGEEEALGEGAVGSEGRRGDAAIRVETSDGETFEPDAVVLAVGITAAKVYQG